MEMNDVLKKLPKHLLDLVIDQPYNDYTAQDHALWRYVMRQNVRFLSQVAHGSYLDGLQKTGISIDRIPHMYGMNRILKEIGWAAVAVDGFIPPAAFMEFQAYKVLVIAADIRPIGQIEYTPAPDIIHEAAGHAPIIADEEYAEYLRLFGEIGSKAFSSAENYRLYEVIRHLSILKTDPYTPKEKITEAEDKLTSMEKTLGAPSEMSLVRNLHWWTVEYGLIGDLDNPKIYGAGLLSSIGESQHALKDSVKKIFYNIDAKNFSFDITNMQPQLFVTPDFEHLTTVLREFEQGMARIKGGAYGIRKALESESDATCEYSSGLQVSGVFTNIIEDDKSAVYLQTTGPTTLNCKGEQLEGHGKDHHTHGFGSPIGMIKGISVPPENLSENELNTHGIAKGQSSSIEYESGVVVKGVLSNVLIQNGKLLVLSFRDCMVKYQDQVLFEPSWGVYDMAVGAEISSCFSGPADPDAYGLRFPVPKEKTHKIIHTDAQKKLFSLYQEVRSLREGTETSVAADELLIKIRNDFPDDWLLAIELLEYAKKENQLTLIEELNLYLKKLMEDRPEFAHLINNCIGC
jgi:phenylalanine-4-hydroxylase